MIIKAFLPIALVTLLFPLTGNAQRPTDSKKLEMLITKGIESAFKASVQMSEYDTVRKQAQQGVFSGVVVSAEGHILTVAHATKPNQVYQVTFPDGSKHLATGLGRIAMKLGAKDLDMAIVKIIDPGKWPFVKMGSSGDAKVNQPVLGISYPGSFHYKLPNVRFGVLTNVDVTSGYLASTCKMEPGDSGGPLFDINGAVIGLHSWIKNDEDENFDVPVDFYKQYWAALNVPMTYIELPEESAVPEKSEGSSISIIDVTGNLVSLSRSNAQAVVEIVSQRSGNKLIINGTVIEYISAGRKGVYVISKSSCVADSIQMMIDGKAIEATVIARDRENDLVLLRAESQLAKGLPISSGQQPILIGPGDLGHLLVTALKDDTKKVGVFSSLYMETPKRFSVGYFGAGAKFIDEKVTITNISSGSAAAGSLKLNDKVIALDGVMLTKPADYGAELSRHLAGDSIMVSIVRDGMPLVIKMYIMGNPLPSHVASNFSGGRSARSDGFKKVFVQDGAIRANECGSPVFDITGRLVGINIARHSRTSTIVMPVDVICGFLARTIKLNP